MTDIQKILEEKYNEYNTFDFIESDPISVPHMFAEKENVEIAGFLTASISWGQRRTIIKNAKRLMLLMNNEPYDFIINASKKEIVKLGSFVHRTFMGMDLQFFIHALKHIYMYYGGLHELITKVYFQKRDLKYSLMELRRVFFEMPHPVHTEKHIADVGRGASAKRLNMFLRWMVRTDTSGVDFGLWNNIPASALYIPLDVHTGKVARDLGILYRKQNDWRAVEELTRNLRKFDFVDPVKYDFALFGMGVFESN